MKSSKKKHHTRLEKALAAAYREREKAEVGELWQLRVMARIRSLGPVGSQTSYLELFQRFVWQLAPVVCILVLLLGVAVTLLDVASDYDIVRMFIEDPADFSLLAMYN